MVMGIGILKSGVWDRDVFHGGWVAGKGKEGDELWVTRVDVISGGRVAEGESVKYIPSGSPP